MSHWRSHGCRVAVHHDTPAPPPLVSVAQFQREFLLWAPATRLPHVYLARKVPQRLEEGKAGVGMGHGGGERGVETSSFKSTEQSVLEGGNSEIRASGCILFFKKRNDLSLMKMSCCSIVVLSPPLTQFHTVSFLTHFLHLLRLFPSRAVLAPNPDQYLA